VAVLTVAVLAVIVLAVPVRGVAVSVMGSPSSRFWVGVATTLTLPPTPDTTVPSAEALALDPEEPVATTAKVYGTPGTSPVTSQFVAEVVHVIGTAPVVEVPVVEVPVVEVLVVEVLVVEVLVVEVLVVEVPVVVVPVVVVPVVEVVVPEGAGALSGDAVTVYPDAPPSDACQETVALSA
jgi:hypothetical protein